MAIAPELAANMAPGFDPIPLAKQLLRSIRSGALATLQADGAPFASLVSIATDVDGAPLVLVSGLSTHTRQLEQNPRCSLLLSQSGKGDPLAHPRLTIIATAERIERESPLGERVRRRFLARQPKAALYVDFPDFSFWRFNPRHFYLNGGFARAWDGPAAEVTTAVDHAAGLIEAEDGALNHMNADHREALNLYATKLCGMPEAPWRATGIDPEGIDLAYADTTARVAFPEPVLNGTDLRNTLAMLARRAREAN